MKNRFNLTLQRSNAPTLQRSNAPTLQRSNAPTRKLRLLGVFILALTLALTNVVLAQQTLCQQIGGNFVPDITIGINEFSSTSTSGLGTASWFNQKVLVNGTLVINSDFLISSCSLKMGKNAVIRIDPGILFQSVLSKYFRCGNDLWKGFVAMGGNGNFWFNHIEDASIAIDIKNASANLIVAGNKINRNNKGMYATNIVLNAIVAGNEFDCTSPINGSTSSLAFAGVQLSNCPSATIGRIDHPGYRNIFRRQTYGIRLFLTTATIGLSTFNSNTQGVAAAGGNVTIRGASIGLTSNFSFNKEDVWASGSNLKVSYCYMENCDKDNITSKNNIDQQQVHIHDNTIHVNINGEFSTPVKYAISLDRSKFGNDNEYRNTIDRNYIILHDFNLKTRGAITVRGSTATQDFMRIDSNTIEVFKGGNSLSPSKFVDVSINGADNFVVTRNKILSHSNSGLSRWGFFMHDGALVLAEGNLFHKNDILGESAINQGGYDHGCCGVHWEHAGPWSICSNTSDHNYRGFHFMGVCGKSSFRRNIIKEHNIVPNSEAHSGAGLIIQGLGANNGFLGDQDCQENLWDPIDYSLSRAYTAVILGEGNNPPGSTTVQKNEFRVEDLNDGQRAPIDRNPMENWFLLDTDNKCLPIPTECPGQNANNFDEHDSWVRDYYPYPQASPGVEEWQTTRYVLAKLMRYPNLATGSTLVFKNAYSQSSAMLFARFDSLMNAVSSATAGSQTTLNSLEASIQSKQAQINALDATIDITYYSTIPVGFMSNRAVLLDELATLSNQRGYLIAQNTSTRIPLLTACEQFNNTLPTNQVYEQNQKVLNTLTIKLARGIELTQTDKDVLHAIAQQCIQIAGRTKSAAASMLPPEEGAQYWRENPEEYNCLEREPNNEQPSMKFMLSPNPVSEVLNVQFENLFVGELIISDLSGRVVQHQHVNDKLKALDIPVEQLNNGVYILSCINSTGKLPSSTKFVVLR